MAIQEVTSPPLLDETGQDIVTELQNIVSALSPNAQGVSYSHATSGLSAENVQEGIDEVKGITDNISNSLTQKTELVDSTYSDDKVRFVKSGNIATIHISGVKNITNGTEIVICNIPSGFAPYDVNSLRNTIYNNSLSPLVRVYASATQIKIYNYTSSSITNANFNMTIPYIVS